jgi:hypothetical protein
VGLAHDVTAIFDDGLEGLPVNYLQKKKRMDETIRSLNLSDRFQFARESTFLQHRFLSGVLGAH